jgi:hypothetical protein
VVGGGSRRRHLNNVGGRDLDVAIEDTRTRDLAFYDLNLCCFICTKIVGRMLRQV